nr:hypothetical protein Iba_chr02cCG10270 [Ipomoea batatas]
MELRFKGGKIFWGSFGGVSRRVRLNGLPKLSSEYADDEERLLPAGMIAEGSEHSEVDHPSRAQDAARQPAGE